MIRRIAPVEALVIDEETHLGHLKWLIEEFCKAFFEVPNIAIKLSGFHYASRVSWEYPYPDTSEIVRLLYEQYGARRLYWGSDYPVVRFHMTYRQALEAFRAHCPFVPEADTNIYRRVAILTYAGTDTATLKRADYTARYDHVSVQVTGK